MRQTMWVIAAAALLAALGCGDKTVSMPAPAAAEGKVMLASGQPVKDVKIFFQPVNAMAPASAVVQADGSFKLQTYENKAGACPGKYRVIFQQMMNSKEEIAKSSAALKSIPAKYQQDNSPLEVEIPFLGNSSLNLTLDAK